MATSLVKTAPHFPGTVISVPDCRSGTHGVPGNNHAMQRSSGRSGKKSCRGMSNEGDPVFGIGGNRLRGILRREMCVSRRSCSSGPPVLQDPPGVFDQTGGRSIRIRARMGLRSGKPVQRSPQRARIGGGVISDNGGPGRGVLGRV